MSPARRDSVSDLVAPRRIEKVATNPRACVEWINDARRHLASAGVLAEADPRLAYAAVHDAARKAITAHMNANGLRPKSGEGSHRAVVAYARERMAPAVDEETLEMVDMLRENRRIAEYGEEPSARIGPAEVRAAIGVAREIVDAAAAALVGPRRRRT